MILTQGNNAIQFLVAIFLVIGTRTTAVAQQPCPPPPLVNYSLTISPSNTISAGTTVLFKVRDSGTGTFLNDICLKADWFIDGVWVYKCTLGDGVSSTSYGFSTNTLLDNNIVTCNVYQVCDCVGATNIPIDNPITMHVSGVLPIELRDFRGNTEGGINHLIWSTASEINSKGFQVERLNSINKVWETLGFVSAQGKAAYYEFLDLQPLNINYYRLRQIDMDGHEQFSKIISLSMPFEKSLKVYPTTVSNVLNVDFAAEKKDSRFHIFNILGQQVQSGVLTQTLDVSVLALGTYIFKVGTEQTKFYKQ
jgi:Secretion system C-terminal sorting domain